MEFLWKICWKNKNFPEGVIFAMFRSLYKMTAADGQQKNDTLCQFRTAYSAGTDGGLPVVSNYAGYVEGSGESRLLPDKAG